MLVSKFNYSYAFIIGIDAYEHGITPLSNAVNDAQAIADLLESKHGYKVWKLLNEEASRDRIQHYLKNRTASSTSKQTIDCCSIFLGTAFS